MKWLYVVAWSLVYIPICVSAANKGAIGEVLLVVVLVVYDERRKARRTRSQ